jgi:hypothetical protein
VNRLAGRAGARNALPARNGICNRLMRAHAAAFQSAEFDRVKPAGVASEWHRWKSSEALGIAGPGRQQVTRRGPPSGFILASCISRQHQSSHTGGGTVRATLTVAWRCISAQRWRRPMKVPRTEYDSARWFCPVGDQAFSRSGGGRSIGRLYLRQSITWRRFAAMRPRNVAAIDHELFQCQSASAGPLHLT